MSVLSFGPYLGILQSSCITWLRCGRKSSFFRFFSNPSKESIAQQLFLSIRQAEMQILGKLTPNIEYEEDEKGDLVLSKAQPLPQSLEESTSILSSLEGNLFYKQMVELKALLAGKGKILSFQVGMEAINSYADVFQLDGLFFRLDKQIVSRCLIDCRNTYSGCVWIFTRKEFPKYIGVYGIRGSVLNLLSAGCDPARKGIAKGLMEQVVKLCKQEGRNELIVPWPLPSMLSTLKALGFVEHNSQEMTPARTFLKPVSGTSNYHILSL